MALAAAAAAAAKEAEAVAALAEEAPDPEMRDGSLALAAKEAAVEALFDDPGIAAGAFETPDVASKCRIEVE